MRKRTIPAWARSEAPNAVSGTLLVVGALASAAALVWTLVSLTASDPMSAFVIIVTGPLLLGGLFLMLVGALSFERASNRPPAEADAGRQAPPGEVPTAEGLVRRDYRSE